MQNLMQAHNVMSQTGIAACLSEDYYSDLKEKSCIM